MVFGFLFTFTAGCVADTAIVVPVRNTGTLTQRWSIGGRFNASLCAVYGADRMKLIIYDTTGRVVMRAFQPCREMEMSVLLETGAYTADAVLIGRDGTDVSTTLQLRPFRVTAGDDTFVDTDFPTDSMLTVLRMRDVDVTMVE